MIKNRKTNVSTDPFADPRDEVKADKCTDREHGNKRDEER